MLGAHDEPQPDLALLRAFDHTETITSTTVPQVSVGVGRVLGVTG